MDELSALRYIMPMIVKTVCSGTVHKSTIGSCQHCDEQEFQTLSCVHYTIFSVVMLDLYIRALFLDRILGKNYAYA